MRSLKHFKGVELMQVLRHPPQVLAWVFGLWVLFYTLLINHCFTTYTFCATKRSVYLLRSLFLPTISFHFTLLIVLVSHSPLLVVH
jgi:hypothetical protein